MKIINLTPYNVQIGDKEFQSTGIAKVLVKEKLTANINGINFYKIEYNSVENLPHEQKDTIFIVSESVKNALPKRKDLACFYKQTRDNNSGIISCCGLSI